MKNNMILVKNAKFGNVKCDVWQRGEDFFMTREQIGQALEYKNPRKAIAKIHNAHKDRLDKFSTVPVLGTVDGKERETFLYSAKGIYEICRWSNQPKANDFYDFIYEVLEGVRTGYLKLQVEKQTEEYKQLRQVSKNLYKQISDTIMDLKGANCPRYYYSNEADMINKIVTGKRKRDFKMSKHKSLRDYLTQDQLDLINRLQDLDFGLLHTEPDLKKRKDILEKFANIVNNNYRIKNVNITISADNAKK